MLYDNAQLATVFSEAYGITARDDFRQVVDELLEFVLREMTDPAGGFYSALDADSEHEEGKYYRWKKEEIERLLAPPEFALFSRIYGLNRAPNFEQEYYVIQLSRSLAEEAAAAGKSTNEFDRQLAPLREELLRQRNQRVRPLIDTKILTSWNGLMIRGFADAGHRLQNPRYVAAARRAADFGLTNLAGPNGRLLRCYAQGTAKLNAYLDDYAFFVNGLIALYRATNEQKWLDAASKLTATQIELFWDSEQGGFYFTTADHETLFARGRDLMDGAEPSGNSVSAENLVFLAQELDNEDFREKARLTFQSMSGLLADSPAAAPRLVIAYDAWRKLQQERQ
jgi:uncharacterized protein YyaL (SSP411 family)